MDAERERDFEDFSLRDFVEFYVSEALRIARGEPPVSKFDNSVRESVSRRFGLDKGVVIHLHHAFHWAFFGGDNCSPLKYVQVTEPGGENYVKLNRRVSRKERGELSEKIIQKYGGYIGARVKSIQ